MQRTINGTTYNTKKSTFLLNRSYGYCGDFSAWDEDLYVTKNGEYFLYGTGGPMTRWSRRVAQNEWSGSTGIIPISAADAMAWLEYDNSDAAETIICARFGDLPRNVEMGY